MKVSQVLLCVFGAAYVLGMIYSRALFSANYVENNGYFSFFLFGERTSDMKALLWPIFILFEL